MGRCFLGATCALLFIWLVNGADDGHAAELLAGLAKTEITAPVGYPLAGYAARKDISQGVHDPLYARVLVLKAGETAIAIVALDIIEFFSSRVSAEARDAWGIECVLLNSSHTHSGPDPKEKEWWNYDRIKHDPWYRSVEDRIIESIGRAMNNLFPARIAAGKGFVQIGYNRRQVNPDGSVTMLWRMEEKRPTSPIDPTAGVIRIDDISGRPRSVIVHYACHPVTLTAENLLFSADYPGEAVGFIEREFGAGCMGFFLQGAGGDINPYKPVDFDPDRSFESTRARGEELGREAVRAARALKPELNYNAEIQVKIDAMTFPKRFEPSGTMELGIATVLINREIAFVSVPGEPFVEFQIDLAARSIVGNTFFLGFTTCGVGAMTPFYIPTIHAAVEGGYGADSETLLEPGTGEAIVDRGIINLYYMLNYLKVLPADAVLK